MTAVGAQTAPDPGYSAQLLRSRIADATDKLIAALDRLDGDSDAEDDDPGGCEHDGREPELA